jgi:hypothetical protein
VESPLKTPEFSLHFLHISQPLNEYQSDCKSECWRSKGLKNCTICIFIKWWYNQNSDT